ncbi:hypothetical protein [Rhizobium azibense]|uniref:DUF3150 domain-containing protein n=1 Tax=Rhizobium azibense TaxID=1136135 RepID=A0A4R3REY1_9HYPH|nr:hypothetical protein [Rhizobium azibense]TCU34100.1 hypothetical protein EV129_11383 [Rhizobium azibense]
MSVLSEKAMLSHVRVSAWTARRIDRKVTDEVNESHGAANDAGRYNKLLVNKEALAPIQSAISAARTFHYSRTLPWQDDGARLLPAAAYLDYTARLRGIRADFDNAVDEFIKGYSKHVEDAKKRLGDLFKPEDYPGEAEIRARFDFKTIINPVPAAEDFRVAVGDAQAEIIRAEIEERAKEQLQEAVRDVYRRVSEVCERMVEKLRNYIPGNDNVKAQGIFRDSLVENVRDLALVLPALNITSDPRLSEIAERMRRELVRHDADTLRENEDLRESVADAAAAILADVSDFLA